MAIMIFFLSVTEQKTKFSIKDFLIWSHVQKKSLMENFIFCAVGVWNFQTIIRRKTSNVRDIWVISSTFKSWQS